MTTALISAVASVLTAVLVYFGARFTASKSKEAATQATAVDAQESAVQAWQSLLQPYRDEVAQLRADLTADRNTAKAERSSLEREITDLKRAMGKLQNEVTTWQRLAKVIARWATKLRDEVIRLGGDLPTTPEELLLVQALDDGRDD